MSKTIVFFNNRGGVGKTTLVYHVAYMFGELGYKCLTIDLDPQANLTSMFLDDEELIRVYTQENDRETILTSIKQFDSGIEGTSAIKIHKVDENIGVVAGDIELSLFEETLSTDWGKCLNGDEKAFRNVSIFHKIVAKASYNFEADFCLIDVAPNLGALNRAILLSADYVIVPTTADLFSLQEMRTLGEKFKTWKKAWSEMIDRNKFNDMLPPKNTFEHLGYLVMQRGILEQRPGKQHPNWVGKIPNAYRTNILGILAEDATTLENDPNCLAILKHYYSLAPMAIETKRPIFLLRPADGAIGAHYQAVRMAYESFKSLCEKIIERIK